VKLACDVPSPWSVSPIDKSKRKNNPGVVGVKPLEASLRKAHGTRSANRGVQMLADALENGR
jgi:hypothetical protein